MSRNAANVAARKDQDVLDGTELRGLRFERVFLPPDARAYDLIEWERRTASITNESGAVIFEQKDVEVPRSWSQLATNVVAQKYFRGRLGSAARESSVKQLIDRVVNTLGRWGREGGYFATEADAVNWEEELRWLLVTQHAAFNSPVWFNIGVPGRAQQASACQPYRALVSTPEGMIPIGQLVERRAIGHLVYDAEGVTRVVAVKANGRRPVMRVRLRNGSFVEATPDHIVLAAEGADGEGRWLRVDQLRCGMRLFLHAHRPAVRLVGAPAGGGCDEMPFGHALATASEAALAGWLQADGFVGQYEQGGVRSLVVELRAKDDEERRWLEGHLERALPDVQRQVTRHTWRSRSGRRSCWRIRLAGEALRSFVERWSLLSGRSRLGVPEALWTAPMEVVSAYLVGVFTVAGYVAARGERDASAARVGLRVLGERWGDEIQILLLSLGIYSRREVVAEARGAAHLVIDAAQERARFAELVGFVGRRQALLLASLDLRRPEPSPDVSHEQIVAIDAVGIEDVYDIQTESGNYLSNNVVVHNCFINSVQDTMESILELAKTEGMLFKFGSGTGTNLSVLRSSKESLSGGGTASGPVSFMRGYDAFAGSIKSGGTTRRAAKMVILNADHPDILDFITCKAEEEKKAWALIEAGYDAGFNVPGGAYDSVQFQNANHSVRVTDEFMRAVEEDGTWTTRAVTDGRVVDRYRARDLWRAIAESAWTCGDPGVQFDDTIQDWNCVPNTGRINATNPCFSGDAEVHTSKGLVPFKELVERINRGESFKVYTHDLTSQDSPADAVVLTRPEAVMITGYREIVRLRFSNGMEVRCTPNHRFFTRNRGYVRADELTERDRVLTLNHPAPAVDARARVSSLSPRDRAGGDRAGEVERTSGWTLDLAHRLGWLVADRVAAAGGNGPGQRPMPSKREPATAVLDAIGRNPSSLSATLQLGPDPDALIGFPPEPDLAIEAQFNPSVLRLIKQAPPDVAAAFLRGAFDASGSVSPQGPTPHVRLTASSEPFLQDIQRLLTTFGIGSRIHAIGASAEGSTPTRPPSEHLAPQLLQLRIAAGDVARFASEIGFSVTSKSEMLRSLVEDAGGDPDSTVTLVERTSDGVELTYNLTEPRNHSYIVNGLVVANCSEFVFVDDTACNLLSLNLLKFQGEDGRFDVERFQHAVDICFTAQEILVSNASYPTPAIARNSERLRPLGMGYANLGALLMSMGLAYDSDEGRRYAGAITAIMTGRAYAQSARMAAIKGPFAEFEKNREAMLRVMAKHRSAAYELDGRGDVGEVARVARKVWDEAVALGERHGYRNAQATVIAPTGTIGLMMDCDTTGIEPDLALVKYKKLVGGGLFKIVNTTVPQALRKLGYSEDQVRDIVEYIDENDTIEGAPHLQDAHLKVFDCAFKPARGVRSIAPMGHVRMMAAVQPFVSGSMSKTVNLPTDATVEDIENVYLESWKLGLKCIAIYRDGCKRSQPLSTRKDTAVAQAPSEHQPVRRKLPDERHSITHKFDIQGHEGYITVGLYEDGTPGEIFLTMNKEGSTLSGLMDSFATQTSLALQYGVPLRIMVNKFSHMRFEPSGFTKNPEIPIAKSIIDYIFRWLASRFLDPEEQEAVGVIRREAETGSIQPPPPSGPTAPARGTYRLTFVGDADAPPCPECGSITVRNGTCYKCMNCGATTGCS